MLSIKQQILFLVEQLAERSPKNLYFRRKTLNDVHEQDIREAIISVAQTQGIHPNCVLGNLEETIFPHSLENYVMDRISLL